MSRKILYVTGTRADYGLMRGSLKQIDSDPRLDLTILVTGMHLDPVYGLTVNEIERDGFVIASRVKTILEGNSGSVMGRAIGEMLVSFTTILESEAPDIVLLLGDRGEMLAGAIAAIHLNIPVVHIHGGERSGTVDELVRHAISKLSHYHFVATKESQKRLIKMGEIPEHVSVVGAPGLDAIREQAIYSRSELISEGKLDPDRKTALMVYHPVLQEMEQGRQNLELMVAALRANEFQIIALMPNADAGSADIRSALKDFAKADDIRVFTHLKRDKFVSWMAIADVMIGNSSSGIIEAASFGTPVINVGSRQNMRERNKNVLDVPAEPEALQSAIDKAGLVGRYEIQNLYGDGDASEKIAELLATLWLEKEILDKYCVY